MTYLDYLEKKVLLERLVIGLEEPVLVKGLGELQAKIDSGNGGYNVIHGTDFHQQGDVLMFTTHDSFGNEKKISTKIIDDIEVNMGGGNIEKRPVIELDIKFAGEDYKKIPFSVSDRSSNTHPILISKGFVENELEALIDVGAKNISNDGVDVVYGESVLSNTANWLKGGDNVSLTAPITNTIKKVGKGVKKLTKNVPNVIGGLYNAGKTVVGDGAGITKGLYNAGKTLTQDAMNAGGLLWDKGANAVNWVKSLRGTQKIAKNVIQKEKLFKKDVSDIRGKITTSTIISKLSKINDIDLNSTIIPNWTKINFDDIPIIPITSFMCDKGGNEKDIINGCEHKRELWKKVIQQAKVITKEIKQQNQQNVEEQEEEIDLCESLTLLEASLILEEVQTSDVEQQQTEEHSVDTFEEAQTDFENLHNFALWFIPFSNAVNPQNKQKLANIEKELTPLDEKYKELLKNNQPLAFGEENLKKLKELKQQKEKLESTIKSAESTVNPESEKEVKIFLKRADGILVKLFSMGEINPEKSTPIINSLASDLITQGIQGFFVMGFTTGEDRDYHFFEDLKSIAYKKKQSPETQESEEELWINSKLQLLKNKDIL